MKILFRVVSLLNKLKINMQVNPARVVYTNLGGGTGGRI